MGGHMTNDTDYNYRSMPQSVHNPSGRISGRITRTRMGLHRFTQSSHNPTISKHFVKSRQNNWLMKSFNHSTILHQSCNFGPIPNFNRHPSRFCWFQDQPTNSTTHSSSRNAIDHSRHTFHPAHAFPVKIPTQSAIPMQSRCNCEIHSQLVDATAGGY